MDNKTDNTRKNSVKRIFKIADFVILAVFIAVIAVFLIFIFGNISGSKKSDEKLIISNGTDEWIYPLNKNERAEIPGKLGKSVIIIEDGKAFFEDSPCDNKLCVYSHKISHVGEWTACLPNGVIIRIEGKKNSAHAPDDANPPIDAWSN